MFSVSDLRGTDLLGVGVQISLNKEVLDKTKIWADVVSEHGRFHFWEGAAADAARLKFGGVSKDFRYFIACHEIIYRGLAQFKEGMTRVKQKFSDLEKECSANSFEITDSSEVIDLKPVSYNIPVGASISLEEKVEIDKAIEERKQLQEELQKRLNIILLIADDVNHDAKRDFDDATVGRINLDKVETVKDVIKLADKQSEFDTAALLDEYRGDKELVKQYWNTLTREEKNNLLENHPEQLATLDGIPFTGGARSEACLRYIPKAKDELEKQRDKLVAKLRKQAYPNNKELKIINDKIAGLDKIEERITKEYAVKDIEEIYKNKDKLAEYNSGDGLSLVSLDTHSSNQLLAATSWGNLDKADHIAVKVGGVTTSVSARLDEMVTNSKLSKAETEYVLKQKNDNHNSVATVAWMGYATPGTTGNSIVEAASHRLSDIGAKNLSGFLTNVDYANHPEHGDLGKGMEYAGKSHITLVGHSYGSTTADKAAQLTAKGVVDDLVLQGSPGITSTDSNLHVSEGHRFVERAPSDDIPLFAKAKPFALGEDPTFRNDFNNLETGEVSPDDYRVKGTVAAEYPDSMSKSYGHSEYDLPVGGQDAESTSKVRTSVYNTSTVVAGHADNAITVDKDTLYQQENEHYNDRVRPVKSVVTPFKNIKDLLSKIDGWVE